MLTYENLYHAPLQALKESIDDWTAMIKKVKELEDEIDANVVEPLKASEWAGKDADAGFAYLKKIAKEFDDAVVEATGIRDLLQDAYDQLKKNQDELYRIHDVDLKREGLRPVWDSHKGDTEIPMPIAPPGDSPYEERMARVRPLITRVLQEAYNAGQVAAWGLNANISGGRGNFSSETDNSLDSARVHRAGTLNYPDREMTTFEGEKMTVEEEKLIKEFTKYQDPINLPLRPDRARKLRSILDEARRVTEERFPDAHRDGQIGNAFKHAYWSALLTREFGAEKAEQFTSAHEGDPDTKPLRQANESMDLYNNEIGRQIAQYNPNASHNELADQVEHAVRNGQVVVRRKDSIVPVDE